MHDVWNKLQTESGSILADKRRTLDDRIQSDGDLPEMREERARFERAIEEAGEPT